MLSDDICRCNGVDGSRICAGRDQCRRFTEPIQTLAPITDWLCQTKAFERRIPLAHEAMVRPDEAKGNPLAGGAYIGGSDS